MEITNPSGYLQIQRLDEGNLPGAQQLFILLHEAFEKGKVLPVSAAYIAGLLRKPEFIIFAAIYNGRVVGGLTAYQLPVYHSELPAVYVCDIAVSPEFQRQGIGKKLLDATSAFCVENGIAEMFVQANEEDEHALDFYRSAGTIEERVRQFTFRIT